jgi:hypothetical protein
MIADQLLNWCDSEMMYHKNELIKFNNANIL